MEPSRILTRRRPVALALAAALAACGGDGADAPPPAPSAGTLFVSDAASGDIARFPTLAPAAGTPFRASVVDTLPAFSFPAPHQALSAEPMAYDTAHDELYVGGMHGGGGADDGIVTVRVFSHASTLGAGAVPSRSIETSAVEAARQLSYDAASDTLTIAGIVGSPVPGYAATLGIVRIAHASAASGTDPGAVAASLAADGAGARIAVDGQRDILYATRWFADNHGSTFLPGIAVIANASAVAGSATRARQVAGTLAATGIALDTARDTLYVTDSQGLWIVRNASAASPTMVGPVAMPLAAGVAVDSGNDRLYVAAGQALVVFEHASALTAQSPAPAPSVVDAAGAGDWFDGIAFR